MTDLKNSQGELQNLINRHHEWLLIHSSGRGFSLQKTEIEISFEREKLLVGFLDDEGFQSWRVTGFMPNGAEIRLSLTRNFETEHKKIRLVPRVAAAGLSDSVELARLERADKIAAVIKENVHNIKLRHVRLNKENGRLAQIIFENPHKRQTGVCADVSGNLTPEFLLSTACRWLAKLGRRRKNPIGEIWIVGEKKQSRALQKLCALLRENWRTRIFIKELARPDADAQREVLRDLPRLEIKDLWRGKTKEIRLPANFQLSETARRIIEFSPAEIDAVFSAQGETLRFAGLPFARVRKIFGAEKCWFGIEKGRSLLTENNLRELIGLVENLREFRRFSSPNKRHAFFQTAPEAWLEAILRKNIRLLDANLILSPLYHQFRAERGKIDLLALRRDGRLVIIELKVAPDREMIWQAAGYWRKIERLRRSGDLQKARLFGDFQIADAPAILYLVAPTLAFHRDFDFSTATLTPDIEIHRFNLAEDWRRKLRVLERRPVGGNNLVKLTSFVL